MSGWTRPQPGPGEEYATAFGVCADRHDPALVAELQRRSHDLVISATEDRRRSRVWWQEAAGRTSREVLATLDQAGLCGPGTRQAAERMLADAGPRGLLVLAHCVATIPPPGHWAAQRARLTGTDEAGEEGDTHQP